MNLTAHLNLPPKDAIAFFEKKGVHLAWDWHDTEAETHAQSFTVAKVTTLDMLSWFQKEIERSLKEGRPFEDFKKSLRPRLQEAGWWGKQEMLDIDTGEITQVQLGSNRRLRTIFQTNVQTSYMAGRYKRYLDNAENRPYWRYVAVMDSRTRAGHAALNGKVWRADDPIWQTLWPPNGWGCRCRVEALSAAEFEQSGAALEDGKNAIVEKEVVINKGGDTLRVKGIRTADDTGKEHVFWPDPGWDHNPALTQSDELQNLLKEKAEKLAAKFPASAASVQTYATGWNPKTAAGAWHDASFADAPDYIRSAIAKAGDPLDVQHTGKDAFCVFHQKINMDGYKDSSLRGQSVWRHEFGHHVDGELGRGKSYLCASSSDVFDAALQADRKALIDMGAHGQVNSKKTLARRAALDSAYDGARQDFMAAADREAWLSARYQKSGIDYTSARAAIEKHAAFPDLLDAAAAQDRYRRIIVAFEERDAQGLLDALTGGVNAQPVLVQKGAGSYVLAYERSTAFGKGTLGQLSDLIGSATKNKVGGFTKSGWGHPNAYYNQSPDKAGTESFANLFCLHGEGGLFWKQVIERMTPEMNRVFLELLK
ncbi:MAG: minor capsid protein [Zoogloeaceae bacterium]|jgi:SPP1 gp7 family putative phage head morphogenesis protein|nr:minor capsid protein [Zoogloeaceae bacterium]